MKTFLFEFENEEDCAMAQALYSRSPKSIEEHIEEIKKRGSGKFLATNYLGYNHGSIGEGGETCFFIEEVSMLAAKAIQDSPLYRGQETSTRYMDMATQPLIGPSNQLVEAQIDLRNIQDRWMDFYRKNLQPLRDDLAKRFPYAEYGRQEEGETEEEAIKKWQKAVNSLGFDIMRSMLPAGIGTKLSWKTDLRNARKNLRRLAHHPLAEVREIAQQLFALALAKYPHSFKPSDLTNCSGYEEMVANDLENGVGAYWIPRSVVEYSENVTLSTIVTARMIQPYREYMDARPPKRELPHKMAGLGFLDWKYVTDFGSFRDMQRHRNGVTEMPLLTCAWSFESWYFSMLPFEMRRQAVALTREMELAINRLKTQWDVSLVDVQYAIGMGFQVPVRQRFGLPASVYTAELRSGEHVHPTARRVAHGMADCLMNVYPNLRLHIDRNPSQFSLKRGEQDLKSSQKGE